MTLSRYAPLLALVATGLFAADSKSADEALVSRIAFGSCLGQDGVQPIWDQVQRAKPDVFVLLGDNVHRGITQGVVPSANVMPRQPLVRLQRQLFAPPVQKRRHPGDVCAPLFRNDCPRRQDDCWRCH